MARREDNITGHPRWQPDGPIRSLDTLEPDATGPRERLRREASSARQVDADLAAAGLSPMDRVDALQLPWLEALFHQPQHSASVLDARALAVRVDEDAMAAAQGLPASALASEVALMEAVYQQLTVARRLCRITARPGLVRAQLKRRWTTLTGLLAVWEATLRD